jgi:hypothetical protein
MDTMYRRAYLAGVIPTLTGCMGSRSPSSSETTTQPPLPESINRIIQIDHVGEIPSQYNTDATVEVVESEINSEQTATIHVEVRNTGENMREYIFNPNPPLARKESDSGPGSLLLARPETLSREADCWRASSYQHGDGRSQIELAPGESVQNTLEIWDVGDGPCLPQGMYHFSVNLPRFEDGDNVNTWSFTLNLKNPG